MKRNLLVLAAVCLLIAACGSPSTPVVQNPPPGVLPTDTPAPTFTPIPTLTPAPLPTQAFPTFVQPTAAPGQPSVIQFPVGGTYVDITDSIPAGSSKTYSVNAMKGQIMSISVLPQIPNGGWGYIPMQIKGADGSVLCPKDANTECTFWRGALPSSQDYLITLTPNGDVPQFVMRVAVNPPGKTTQIFQYYNPASKISLSYSDEFAPAPPVAGNYKFTPELSLHYIDNTVYESTNLGEVYLFIGSSADAGQVATCTDPNPNGGGPEQLIGNEIINGYTFVHSNSLGAGAGNFYEQEIYRMANNGVCYEVIYFIHSGNIGNYPPGLVTEFDKNAIVQKLYSVFSTFAIK